MSKINAKQKNRSKAPQHPRIPPIEPGSGSDEIMEQIEFYNETGNGVALWVIYYLCAKHNRTPPEQVATFVLSVASKIAEAALHNPNGAMDKLNHWAVGRPVQAGTGGRSPFRKSMFIQQERRLIRLLNEAMADARLFGLIRKSKTAVYDDVAEKTGESPERLKKLFEREDKKYGSFSISAMEKAIKAAQTGIVDLA